MPINFQDVNCQGKTEAEKFGLVDNENSMPAYISHNTDEQWNATVVNQNNIAVTFTAIDHCISILREDGSMERRCDGMLTYTDNIIFVEFKTGSSGWMPEGINQLETTINIFKDHNDLSAFKRRRAVVANCKHPRFRVISNEDKQRFYSKFKVRLHVEDTIII